MGDQSAYANSVSARTMSHAATSHHDDGAEDGQSQASVFSYRSEIDSSRFLREMGGRVSIPSSRKAPLTRFNSLPFGRPDV